jgi:cob(I)alamin adenosyltransferase
MNTVKNPIALGAQSVSASLGHGVQKQSVLHGINLDIAAGRWTSIVGPNGAGKSTLLRALAGVLPHSGSVTLLGQPLHSLPHRERARQLAWLGQNETSADDLTVWDVAMLGRLPHQAWLAPPSAADHAAVEQALRATRAWDWRQRALGQLSGGERQRVLLARALAVQAQVLLMDEPLANLDPPHQADWLDVVRALVAEGKTVVSVLHEITMALQADTLVVMAEGRVTHQGPCAEPATHRALEDVFDGRIVVHPLQGQWIALPKVNRPAKRSPMQIETPPVDYERVVPTAERRGLILVNTGHGKGKSTAAFGLALRAHGRGKAVKVYQFMKVPTARFGEHRLFEQLGVPIEGLGDGFSWKSRDLEHSAQLALDGWAKAEATLRAGEHFMVVLDEIMYPLRYGWIPLEAVLTCLRERPPHVHVVLTGRNAPAELVDLADTVTEMTLIKHHFKAGVPAQRGIED